jgi:hypothetical protein
MAEDRDELIGRVAAALRGAPALSPDLDARIMARVRRERVPGTWRAAWAALRRPRQMFVSPLGGLAVAAGVAALVVGAAVLSPARRGVPAASLAQAPAPDSLTQVQFVLVMRSAGSVALVGDFNDWNVGAQQLQQVSQNGVWSVTVPLAPGRYRYTFVVNGNRWIADPAAPTTVDDDFGRPNSIITVAGRGT